MAIYRSVVHAQRFRTDANKIKLYNAFVTPILHDNSVSVQSRCDGMINNGTPRSEIARESRNQFVLVCKFLCVMMM